MTKGVNYNPGKTEVTIFCKDTLGHTGTLAGLNARHGGAEVTNRRDKRCKIGDGTDAPPPSGGFLSTLFNVLRLRTTPDLQVDVSL